MFHLTISSLVQTPQQSFVQQIPHTYGEAREELMIIACTSEYVSYK